MVLCLNSGYENQRSFPGYFGEIISCLLNASFLLLDMTADEGETRNCHSYFSTMRSTSLGQIQKKKRGVGDKGKKDPKKLGALNELAPPYSFV